MKKFTAILVMTAMLCSLVSCGQDTADEIESSVTSVAEESTEEITEEITESETAEVEEEPTEETTEEITEPETEEISKASVVGTEEYAEVIEKLLEYQNNYSYDVIDLLFPDKYCDTIKVLHKADLFSLYGTLGSGTVPVDLGLMSIDSVEPVAEEYMPYFNLYYGCYQPLYEYIEENGTENPDIDKLSELMSTPLTEEPDTYFNIEKAVIVSTTISREFNNGEDDPDYLKVVEQEYVLYYIDGEGWKVDTITIWNLYEEERKIVLEELRTLYSASETVLSELQETGTEIPENCIICSDISRNYNVSEEFLNTFDNALDGCYQKKDGFDYFIMINDDELACVTGQYARNPRSYQSFPMLYWYDEDGYVIGSYDERYNLCLERMKNNQPQSYMKD
ncbi:MAG: hypothetical protein NC177_00505 [Ruminococcus flavefaciens]|nr:hypothetical protein [Ruminococcus flavefaciens]